MQHLLLNLPLIKAVKLSASDDASRYVPGYVWILHGWYKQRWWTADNDTVECTNERLEVLLRNSISILQIPAADNVTAPTDVELVSSVLVHHYRLPIKIKFSKLHVAQLKRVLHRQSFHLIPFALVPISFPTM